MRGVVPRHDMLDQLVVAHRGRGRHAGNYARLLAAVQCRERLCHFVHVGPGKLDCFLQRHSAVAAVVNVEGVKYRVCLGESRGDVADGALP